MAASIIHFKTPADINNTFSLFCTEIGLKLHSWIELDNIVGGFAQYQRLQSSNDDDAIDRLNHIYTVTLLVVFSIFVSGKQFVGNPIECFSEQEELRMGKLEYAKVFCWLRNTYVVEGDGYSSSSPKAALPVRDQDRRAAEIHYYQWVPILLLVMAGLLKLPNLVWRVFSLGSGLDLNQLASLVISTQCAPTDKYQETLKQIAEYMDRWLEGHRPRCWNIFVRAKMVMSKRCIFFPWGKRFGTYLTGLSLLTKLMFACVDIGVFFMLQHVLGSWYSFYGFQLLVGVATDSRLPTDSPYFPKVTFCDMEVRQMSNLQRLTLQCVLPINIFNEKIFAFLWFWMLALTVVTVGNFLYWASLWAFGNLHYSKVHRYLQAAGVTESQRQLAHTFAHSYLRKDGALVLDVIRKNSSSVMVDHLVAELWALYTKGATTRERLDKGGDAKERRAPGKMQGDILYI